MADLTLAIRVATETFGTEKLNDVERAMGGLGSASKAAQQVLPAVAVATAGLTAALGSSINAAAEFEQTMDGALAVMSPADVNKFGASLENLALRLGKETSFSAKEAAAGIEELIKGGLSATDVLNGAAESTLALAAAGGVSLPDAATIAANALAQFSLEGSDMAHVADLIAGAANASAIDVNQFKFSLQAAGAVAATVGFSFDDLATGIAVMGKAGIAGSDAGTSLKTMMLSLQPATNKTKEEFNKLGITGLKSAEAMAWLRERGFEPVAESGEELQNQVIRLMSDMTGMEDITAEMTDRFYEEAKAAGLLGNQFFDASGKVKPMAEVAEVLRVAMKDMTEQQRLASLEILFGSDAIRAGAILAKEGAAGFNEMAAAMGEVAAVDVASARLDNLKGATDALGGSFETVQITIGQFLLPTMRAIVDVATRVLNGFLDLSPGVQKFIAFALVAATAIGAVSTVALTLVAILPTLVAGFGAAATIAGVVGAVLAGPLLLAVGGVALAVGALFLAWNTNFLGIQDVVRGFWEFVSPVFGMVADALNVFSREVAPEAAKAWTVLTATAQAVWQALMDYFKPIWDAFKEDWMAAWPLISTVATAAFTVIDTVIRVIWEALKGWIIALLKVLQGDWQGAWDAIKDGMLGAWKIMDERIRDVLPKLGAYIGEQWEAVKTKHNEIWGQPDGVIPKAMRDAWDGMVNAIKDAIKKIIDALGQLANEAFEKAKEIGAKIIDGVKSAIEGAGGAVADAIRSVVDNAIKSAQEAISRWRPSLPSISVPTIGRGGGAVVPGMPAVEDSGEWVSPLRGPVSQEFGRTAFAVANPKMYPGGIHTGIDLGVGVGTQLMAARSGRVDTAGWDTSGYGNLVAITHSNGFRTLYAHLSEIAVKAGQNVISGQKIGATGNTGMSTAAHLHFEVREQGSPVNPRRFVGFGTGGVVPGPIGAGMPIMAHGGEVILRPDQAEAMGTGMRRGFGGGQGMTDSQIDRLAVRFAEAVMGMRVQIGGAGFNDAVIGSIVDGTRRGRLAQSVNEAYGSR